MKTEINIKSKGLPYLAIFLGWSTDKSITEHITSNNLNTIFVYDYSDYDYECDTIIRLLNDISSNLTVIAWSMGVWAYSCRIRPFLSKKPQKEIALMGTPYGIDKDYGIKPLVFKATLDNFSKQSYEIFLKRAGIPQRPQRDTENIKNELASLWENRNINPDLSLLSFDIAVCGLKDRIFMPDAQRAAWKKLSVKYIETEDMHYPFSKIKRWEQFTDDSFIHG